MKKPAYDLVALDLDGTLTNSRKIVTPKTKDALFRASASGVKIVLASGRPLQGVLPVAEAIDLKSMGGYLLSENGARVTDAFGQTIFERALPEGFVPEIADFARKYAVSALAYNDTHVVSEHIDDQYVRYEARNDAMGLLKVDDFAKRVQWPCHKLMLVGDPEKLAPCAEYLKEYYAGRLNVFRSESYFLEVLPPGIDKPFGLSKLLSCLKIERERLMACGDGLNDIDMLKFAGLGVAMANAYPQTKAAADQTTLSNDEDGVAAAIDRFVLS